MENEHRHPLLCLRAPTLVTLKIASIRRRNEMKASVSLNSVALAFATPFVHVSAFGSRPEAGRCSGENIVTIGRRPFLASAAAAAAAATLAAPAPASADVEAVPGSVSTYAYRSGGLPTLRPLGLGLLQRYEGYTEAPAKSSRRQIAVAFDFPSDWFQLDKLGGGVTYVDQRNGDKLYLLRTTLPEGTTLTTVPKTFFADSVFDPRGDIVRSGTVVEGGRVAKSTILNDGEEKGSLPRRRLLMKYDVVTGSGVQTVERRGLVDAYEVDGDAYMLVTGSNAVKFEAKGKERDTVEAIVDSFRVQ